MEVHQELVHQERHHAVDRVGIGLADVLDCDVDGPSIGHGDAVAGLARLAETVVEGGQVLDRQPHDVQLLEERGRAGDVGRGDDLDSDLEGPIGRLVPNAIHAVRSNPLAGVVGDEQVVLKGHINRTKN